jgi:Fic family protein
MIWNWQQPDWPRFSWDAAILRKAEAEFLRGSGLLEGVLRYLPEADKEILLVEALCSEALRTSEIEGEILDRASVQSSIRRQLGLATEKRNVRAAEQGIAEMMIDLCRSFAGPLREEVLFSWHRMIMQGRWELHDIGRYRSGHEPMQVVSGSLYSPKVHFEAPPASRIRKEMSKFIQWFNRHGVGGSRPSGSGEQPPLTRAGIAHLYFESIHPFEDGNGRIGRAISEKALAQGAGHSTITALAETILIHRKDYYAALEAANKSNEITPWLRWFAGCAIEAQRRTLANIEFLVDKTRLLDRLRGTLNERQEKALLRVLREGPEGFEGGLSAGNYSRITGSSAATTTRDLADLVEKKALHRSGERRYARYHLAIPLRATRPMRIDRHGNLSEQG